MKKLLAILCLCLLLLPRPAAAQDGEENAESLPAARSHVVTSLQKCFDQLAPEDALDIRRNYLKPYQECQSRLLLKAEEAKKKKLKDAADAESTPPETPRNYVRVQKTPAKSTSSDR